MIDLSKYKEDYSMSFKIKRYFWLLINATIFRLLIGSIFRIPRIYILNLFGGKIAKNSLIYSSCKIWAPWNLVLEDYGCIGPNTQIYNKDQIKIGKNSVISQGVFLCSASHDISDKHNLLITAPIIIKDQAWVAADAFVGMGVTIGQGAVVGARAAVFKDVADWTVVGGNPAKFIKKREIIK